MLFLNKSFIEWFGFCSHDYGKWKTIHDIRMTATVKIIQSRECKKCGKVKTREEYC